MEQSPFDSEKKLDPELQKFLGDDTNQGSIENQSSTEKIRHKKFPQEYMDQARQMFESHASLSKTRNAEMLAFFGHTPGRLEDFFESKQITDSTYQSRKARGNWEKIFDGLISKGQLIEENGLYHSVPDQSSPESEEISPEPPLVYVPPPPVYEEEKSSVETDTPLESSEESSSIITEQDSADVPEEKEPLDLGPMSDEEKTRFNEAKADWQVPDRTIRPRQDFEAEKKSIELEPMSPEEKSRFETEKATWQVPDRTVQTPKTAEGVSDGEPGGIKINEEIMGNVAHAEISNTGISQKMEEYINNAERAIPLKELRAQLASAQNEAETRSTIEHSEMLSDEQKKELIDFIVPEKMPEPPPVYETQETSTQTSQSEESWEKVLQEMKSGIPGASESIPLPEQVTEDEMYTALENARQTFAREEFNYRKQIGTYGKLKGAIGLDNSSSLPEKNPEYMRAHDAYMQARFNYVRFKAQEKVSDENFPPVPPAPQVSLERDARSREEAEDEYVALRKQLEALAPEKTNTEKVLAKYWESYMRLSPRKRMLISAGVLSLGSFAFGNVGVVGALSAFGWRVSRSIVGGAVGAKVGQVYGERLDRKMEEEKQERLHIYTAGALQDIESFKKSEMQLADYFAEQERKIKQNRLKKAALMATVAGFTTLGSTKVLHSLLDSDIPVSGKGVAHPEPNVRPSHTVSGVKPSPFGSEVGKVTEQVMDQKGATFEESGGVEEVGKPLSPGMGNLLDESSKNFEDINTPKPMSPGMEQLLTDSSEKFEEIDATPSEVIENQDVPPSVSPEAFPEPLSVDVSQKEFVTALDELKDRMSGKPLSPALEKLLDQEPEKIAEDLKLYTPGQNPYDSVGAPGDHLMVTPEGGIVLEHGTGDQEVLFESTPSVKVPPLSPITEQEFTDIKIPQSPEGGISTVQQDIVPEYTPETLTIKPLSELLSVSDADLEKIDVVTEHNGSLVFQNTEIASPSPEYHAMSDMLDGKLPLKKEFQFNDEFSDIRKSYAIKFLHTLKNIDRGVLDDYRSFEYKGGLLNFLRKGDDITILLNGEKLAEGNIVNGVPVIQYEDSLGHGFLLKNGYEIAFEHAKKIIAESK